MLPDAINTNIQVAKNKKDVSAPNVSTVKNFSQLNKSVTFHNVNFKALANTQSKKATETSKQSKEANVINVDFNKSKQTTTSPVDVPTFADTPEIADRIKEKSKRGFFEKIWDKHSYHILGSLDANPAGKFVKLGVGFFTLGSIRKVTGPIFKETAEATKVANDLGYKKINEMIHGQAIYKKGRRYITPDADGHNGGAWKVANSVKNLGAKETRKGTFNIDLTVKVGK